MHGNDSMINRLGISKICTEELYSIVNIYHSNANKIMNFNSFHTRIHTSTASVESILMSRRRKNSI